jgi:hypothetical protein
MAIKMTKRVCRHCETEFSFPTTDLNVRDPKFCSKTCSYTSRRVVVGLRDFTPKQIERFEAKFTPEPMSGCWLWFGAHNDRGYGSVNFNKVREEAHRIAWRIYCGPIGDGLSVCHRCDNPACVNPDHLFLGTQTDNMRDCSNKGRVKIPHHKGEQNSSAKLTDALVRQIRAGGSLRYWNRITGVSMTSIGYARSGKTWRHV